MTKQRGGTTAEAKAKKIDLRRERKTVEIKDTENGLEKEEEIQG